MSGLIRPRIRDFRDLFGLDGSTRPETGLSDTVSKDWDTIFGRFFLCAGAIGGLGMNALPDRVRPNGTRVCRCAYPGCSLAAAAWNSSWRGQELESGNRIRRVLRSTTAPIFSNLSRIVPTWAQSFDIGLSN